MVSPLAPKGARPAAGLVLALVLLGGLYWTLRGRVVAPTPAATAAAARKAAADKAVPRIGLDRLNAQPTGAARGTRDIFDFGVPPATPTPPPPPVAVTAETAQAVATPPPVPPLTLKYIGAVENGQGVKVAVLLTDRKEVLTGQTGDVVANRYRIVKIGLESVDIQEVGSDRVRRVPLKSN
jgi:hypothetical protein